MKRKEIKKQTDPEKILMKLIDGRVQNVQMLINWSYADLKEMKKRYWEAYQDFKSEIIYEKFSQIDEAIQVKQGNDEQAWDFLT